jgi:hypothetical protein
MQHIVIYAPTAKPRRYLKDGKDIHPYETKVDRDMRVNKLQNVSLYGCNSVVVEYGMTIGGNVLMRDATDGHIVENGHG